MLDPTTAITHSDAALDGEVFALAPCVLDGASESDGMLCLVLDDGAAVRIPVKREKVGAVARALMGRPAVILLAREGAVVTATLPESTAALPDARTYADGINDAARAVAKVALDYYHTTLPRIALDRAQDAVAALRGEAPPEADSAAQANHDWSTLRTHLTATETKLIETARDLASLTRAVLAAAEGRSIDADAVTLERRPAALALQNVAKVMREAAMGADRWARETRSLSEERDGLRRAVQMLDTVLRGTAAELQWHLDEVPSADEVPDTMAREVVAMVRAAVRLLKAKAPAVPFDPTKHCDRAAVMKALDKLAVGYGFQSTRCHDMPNLADAYLAVERDINELAAHFRPSEAA